MTGSQDFPGRHDERIRTMIEKQDEGVRIAPGGYRLGNGYEGIASAVVPSLAEAAEVAGRRVNAASPYRGFVQLRVDGLRAGTQWCARNRWTGEIVQPGPDGVALVHGYEEDWTPEIYR